MKTKIASLLAAAALLVGCITPQKAVVICPEVTRISERTALRVLDKNNNSDTRDALAAAVVTLRAASAKPQFDFDSLIDILDGLPVGALKDEDTRLYVDYGILTLKLLLPDGTAVDLSKYESAQVIANCIAEGIESGLNKIGEPPVVLIPTDGFIPGFDHGAGTLLWSPYNGRIIYSTLPDSGFITPGNSVLIEGFEIIDQ